MNGTFKFKENFFLKYKKEIVLTIGGLLTLVTVVKFTGSDVSKNREDNGSKSAVIEETVTANGYNMMLGDLNIGIVASLDDGQAIVNKAIELAIVELGYNPETEPEITYEENYSLEGNYIAVDDFAMTLKEHFIESLEEVKVKAYVMKIGDDFTIAVASEDDIKEILKRAQSMYISTDMVLDITLDKDEHNSMVLKPEVVMAKEDATSRSFQTVTDTEEGIDDSTGETVEEDVDATEEVKRRIETDVDEEKTEEAVDTEETEEVVDVEKIEDVVDIEEELDVRKDGVTVDVGFAESVMVVEAYVFESEILTTDDATLAITKENEEAKTYLVSSGDVPSIIAETNEMKLATLYDLNPGLEANATKLQIGDELVVMVPEPELSVSTKEEVVYTEEIGRGVTYINDADHYVTVERTIDAGYDGVMEVTALVYKVNGDEVNREIIDELVIKEAKDIVKSVGTKPLPTKGATGKFITPLEEYRLTSPFGPRWGSFHYGVDMAAATGTSVRASDGGTVTIAGWQGNYGYLVEIDHGDGITTRYGHNSKIEVVVGQEVAQYEEIAKVGSTGRSTGPHVHFEIRFDGVATNPMDYLE